MIALIALTAFVPVAYALPEKPTQFDVGVTFDGFVPILNGKEGVFEVQMTVDAWSAGKDDEGNLRTTGELSAFKVKVNGGVLPLDVSAASDYFPKTTISMSPQGKMLKTDAPDRKLPIKLPGLDVKRFPDISYIPIQFPAEGVEEGKSFTFAKAFGDSDVTYEVTPTKITDSEIQMSLKVNQRYEVLENDQVQVVTDPSLATARVHTEMVGSGTAKFGRALGYVTQLKLEALVTSRVEDLASKKIQERKLKTILSIQAKPPK